MSTPVQQIAVIFYLDILSLFRMGGEGAKGPPTSFSTETSTNVEFGPQTLFPHWYRKFLTSLAKICTKKKKSYSEEELAKKGTNLKDSEMI